MPINKIGGTLLTALLMLSASGAEAQQDSPAIPQPAPVSAYFANPDFVQAALSPSGKYLGAIVSHETEHDRLIVIDLDTLKSNVAAHFALDDVSEFQWMNDERLVLTAGNKNIPVGAIEAMSGLFAVNRDGSKPIQLAARGLVQRGKLPLNTFLLKQTGAQDSDFIYVENRNFDKADGKFTGTVDLKKLNVVTGWADWASIPKADPIGWVLDQHGEPRIALTRNQGNMVPYLQREPDKWEILVATGPDNKQWAVRPLAFANDNLLYVTSPIDDKAMVRALDLATMKLGEPLIELDGYDFDGELYIRDGKLAGMRFSTEGDGNMWFDVELKATQAEIDKLLPNTVNLLMLAKQASSNNVLVYSYSDRQPPAYYAYRRNSHQLVKVGQQFPEIEPARQARQKMVAYSARDGMRIPALLTLPPTQATAKAPMVVLVHGGPYVRGSKWGWNSESQFLASRGYVVLEPFFRGTTGFGAKHFKAGWKQWGLKMQDDLADGARWAVESGYADSRRICIAGGSYGGYAALMGILNDPDIFQCAVDFAGVTDFELFYNGHWLYTSDMTAEAKEYGLPVLVGDLEKDAAQLKATSPIEQVERIRRPILMGHGDADHRVPILHSKRFLREVRVHNRKVEFAEYDDEGHGLKLAKNRIDFWTRVERFLDRNIGKDSPKQ
jgi:dipeptidyl aminopeptidase/acylaminoacyl peptidase